LNPFPKVNRIHHSEPPRFYTPPPITLLLLQKKGALLAGVSHALLGLVLLLHTTLGKEGLLVGSLLILLDEGAAATAAGDEDIADAVAFEVVLGANVGALHGEGNEGETDARGADEEKALKFPG